MNIDELVNRNVTINNIIYIYIYTLLKFVSKTSLQIIEHLLLNHSINPIYIE